MTHGRTVKYDSERVPLPLRLALATGNLDMKTNAVVSRILIDERTGRAIGVEYLDRLTGDAKEVRARVVVLCASTIESVRILLNSQSAKHPSGIGGSAGVLGRYLCDHVAYSRMGRVSNDDVECGLNEDGFDFAATGFYIPSFCEKEEKSFPGGYGIQVAIGRGTPTWGLFAYGEMQPRYENHVTLDPVVKDAWGIPVARIECGHSRNELDMVAHMKRRLPEIAAAGGLKVSRAFELGRGSALLRPLQSRFSATYDAFWPGGAIHETGGARMGDDPANSVVNSFCQCWDADNVFVADGACFVTSGFQNPTLTMMALAVRASRFIVNEYGKCVN
jgi:choline dehydrogenase-like flavoprotein